VALLTHATFSGLFAAMSFMGASVEQAYKTMLDLAVVLQLVPFLYMYGALVDLARLPADGRGYYSKGMLWFAGLSGLLTTAIGMVVAFIPQRAGEPVWLFEAKMGLGTIFFLGLAAFFYFPYSRRKRIEDAAPAAGEMRPAGGAQ
jgi:hypothetical protein